MGDLVLISSSSSVSLIIKAEGHVMFRMLYTHKILEYLFLSVFFFCERLIQPYCAGFSDGSTRSGPAPAALPNHK